jgi:hypothetical protein
MPTLDMRTTCLITGMVLVIIAVYLVYIKLMNSRLMGVGWWALGALSGGAGLLLLGMRYLWPDWLTVVAANLLLGLFVVLIQLGLTRFLGRRVNPWPHLAWTALLGAGVFHWTYLRPSVDARVVLISFFTIGYCLRCLWLLTRGGASPGARSWPLLISIGAVLLVHALRGFSSLFRQQATSSLMDMSHWHAIGLLAFAAGSFLITTGLVYLTIQRMADDLRHARAELRRLGGLLPICASCKRIRDDQGYWHQVEQYIQTHSEAEFTHGICPECMQRLYPEAAAKILDDPRGAARPRPEPGAFRDSPNN